MTLMITSFLNVAPELLSYLEFPLTLSPFSALSGYSAREENMDKNRWSHVMSKGRCYETELK